MKNTTCVVWEYGTFRVGGSNILIPHLQGLRNWIQYHRMDEIYSMTILQ